MQLVVWRCAARYRHGEKCGVASKAFRLDLKKMELVARGQMHLVVNTDEVVVPQKGHSR